MSPVVDKSPIFAPN